MYYIVGKLSPHTEMYYIAEIHLEMYTGYISEIVLILGGN